MSDPRPTTRDRPTAEVLYVAYGSNLDPDRFRCYISGGCPAGASRTYRGCRDPEMVGDGVPLRIPHRLRFAGYSGIWDGAAAFVDVERGGWSYAVGYPLILTQFVDVVAQENGAEAGELGPIELPVAGTASTLEVRGWYDTLIGLESVGALPAVTFTAATRPEPSPGRASEAYVATIAAGLSAHHRLCRSAASAYLEAASRT